MSAVSGLVIAVLFLTVALVAFAVGREAGHVDRAHAAHIARQLHPSHSRAIVDQPRGEHVRVMRDGAPVYDWAADDDGGAEQGGRGAADGFGTD
jgi:hypothetical protein